MFSKLDEVEVRFDSIEKELALPETINDHVRFQKLSKEHSSLLPIIETYREYKKIKENYLHNEELIKTENDEELKSLAQSENSEFEKILDELEKKLRILLLPKDPNDEKNILLEIRAGTGGDEASIFAADLFRMYSRFAEKRGWKVEVMSMNPSGVGGFKEVISLIKGERVFSYLKWERGVHRVQRVPKTETQGRIHTSTVTVAVLPEADDIEINIEPNDIRIDVFRSSGPGGQSVNTTDSAVRITHLPTNLVVTCQDEKSQHKNKAKALTILKTRLLAMKQKEQNEKIADNRRAQVGTGERSEKIRTYNFPQGRVTDHRIGLTIYQLDSYLDGNIDEMINAMMAFFEAEALKKETLKLG